MALIEMVLQAQQYIPGIPQGPEAAMETACRNDKITVDSWHKIWVDQTRANSRHGFSENSAMQEFGKCAYQPVIVAGSGPSLKKNWHVMRGDDTQAGRKGLKIVSALHNFGFFEDRDVMGPDDYYVTLDAGDITMSEVTEGGTKHPDEWYWERTKDRTLVAYVGAWPPLIDKWQGRIIWFMTPFANEALKNDMMDLVLTGEVPCLSVGGNVLGACWYFARTILGGSVPIFIGADFSFGYDRKFHAWESQYDSKFAGVMPWTDIYGNRVWTWPSYFGFKNWFDYMAVGGAGGNAQMMINATEGGIMGAYPDGNIQQIIQLDLKTALALFTQWTKVPELLAKSKDGLIHLLM